MKGSVIAVIIAFALGLYVGVSKMGKNTEIIHDTIRKVETITRIDTVYTTSSYRLPYVYFCTTKPDTILINKDTLLVRETKQYKDSTYSAWVSGIDARLDSIETIDREIYHTDTLKIYTDIYIKQQKRKPKFGPSAGMFLGTDGKIHLGAGIAITF